MARKYYGSFLSIENIEYRVELWDGATGSSANNFASRYATRVTAAGGYQEGETCLLEKLVELEDATELTLAGDGFTIERQGQGNTYYENFCRPSRISTNWVMPSDTVRNAFIAIANSQENRYAIVVYRADALYYVGRVVADQADYLRESINGAPVFDLVAVDSLNLLEGFFVSPDWFTDSLATGLDIVRKSLELCGLDDYWTALGAKIPIYATALQCMTRRRQVTKGWLTLSLTCLAFTIALTLSRMFNLLTLPTPSRLAQI